MSKLSFQFERITPWAREVVGKSSVQYVKILNPWQTDAGLFPGKKVIGRITQQAVDDACISQGAAGARRYFEICKVRYAECPWVWAWEGPNEPLLKTEAQARNWSDFAEVWVSLMHGAGLRAIVLSSSVGQPEVGLGQYLARGVRGADGISFNEYFDHVPFNTTDDDDIGWTLLRYRRTLKEMADAGLSAIPPVFIGEFGHDRFIDGHHKGWTTAMSREDFWALCQWYDARVCAHPRVAQVFPFVSGPFEDSDWQTFDVDEELARRIAALSPAPAPPPPTETWYWPLREIYVTQEYKDGHKAVDLRAPTGTPVYAVADGSVSQNVGTNYGNFLLHYLPDNYVAVCAHLKEITKTGMVKAGEQIAIADATGLCDPPGAAHLHFEIRDTQQRRYNPMVFLRERQAKYPEPAPTPPAQDAAYWKVRFEELYNALSNIGADIDALLESCDG